jgi:hypothetical protein
VTLSSIFGDAPVQALATQRITLELQRVGATIRSSANLETFMTEGLYRELVYRLEAYVLAEKLVGDTYETTVDKLVNFDVPVRRPASWFQHFKQDHLPTIARRWPVRYVEELVLVERRVTVPVKMTFERYATYPQADIAVPHDRLGAPVIFERVVPA